MGTTSSAPDLAQFTRYSSQLSRGYIRIVITSSLQHEQYVKVYTTAAIKLARGDKLLSPAAKLYKSEDALAIEIKRAGGKAELAAELIIPSLPPPKFASVVPETQAAVYQLIGGEAVLDVAMSTLASASGSSIPLGLVENF